MLTMNSTTHALTSGITQTRDFIRLLLAANPTRFDYALLITGTVAAVLAGLPFPLTGLLYGRLLDNLNIDCGHPDPDNVYKAIATKVSLVAVLALFSFAVIYLYMGAWTLFGERLVYRIRCAYLRAILRQDIAYFDALPVGEMATTLDSSMQAIQTGTSEKVGIYIFSLFYFIVAYAVCFAVDFKLTLIMSSLIPVFFASSALGNHFTTKYTSRVNEGVEKAMSVASECLSNVSVVLAFDARSHFESVFAGHLLRVRPDSVGKFSTAACQLGFMYLVAYTSNCIAVWQGSKQIADAVQDEDHSFQFGSIYIVTMLILDASFVLTTMSPYLTMFVGATEAHQKLEETMQRRSEIDGTNDFQGDTFRRAQGHIKLCDVSFAYPSRLDVPVLSNLDLEITPQKITALVGASGSGKSTVAALIARLYDPSDGQVLLDDVDVKTLNVGFLRHQIAVVEQDPELMDLSILENVAAGISLNGINDSQTDSTLADLVDRVRKGSNLDELLWAAPELKPYVDRVRKALHQSRALAFAESMDYGLATGVGPQGKQLSGGQRQRVALARALVREAPIIVLDEATAALDSENEALIQSMIEREFRGKTILLIAHRLSTLKHADNIIVLKDGTVAEKGNFNSLVTQGGSFASMVQLQSLKSANESSGPPAVDTVKDDAKYEVSDNMDDIAPLYEDEDDDTPLLSDPLQPKTTADPQTSLSLFRQILALASPQKVSTAIGTAAAVLVGLSHTFEALLMGHTVSALNVCNPESTIRSNGARMGLSFFFVGILEFLFNFTSSSAFSWVAENLVFKTRVISLRALLTRDAQWHESEKRTPASLLDSLTGDTTSLAGMTGSILGIALSVVVSLVAGVVLSHIIAWRIAVVLLAAIPLLLLSGYMRLTVLAKFQETHRAAFSRSVAVASDSVACIRTVALYGLEDRALEAYKRALSGPYNATLRTALIGNFWLASSYSVANMIFGLGYWWGAKMILAGYYNQGDFLTVLPAILVGAQHAGQLFSLAPDIVKAGGGARRVLELIRLAPSHTTDDASPARRAGRESAGNDSVELDELEGMLSFSPTRNSSPLGVSTAPGLCLSFQNVSFIYPSRPQPVLNDVSFTIPASTFAGLVGPSASGKSTLLALALNLYKPTSGRMLINDIPVRSEHFKSEVAWVPQSPTLFSGTVAENIRLGKQNASNEEVENAARAAHIHDPITRAGGYGTAMGPSGKGFSGGERQRIALARALIRDAKLLLLDEPTSALDAGSEALWQETMHELRQKGVTIVVAAHRLATIRRADVNHYIQEGRVVASGSHEELMAWEGYRRAVEGQMVD